MRERNWAGNLTYRATRVARPETVAEVRALVAGADVVKALGTRHSFNPLADTTGLHLDLTGLSIPPVLDREAGTVTLGAGVRYGEIVPWLHEQGVALANLASLPHCTIAGTIATATHGSGRRNQNLAAAVRGLDLVTADGELRRFTRADPEFPGLPVGLGALGVLTAVTLAVRPPFTVRQDGYAGLDWDTVLADWPAIQDAGYSVSLFTTWTGPDAGLLLVKSLPDTPVPDLLRTATPAGPPQDNYGVWGAPGPWHERLAHFRLDATPSFGAELQSEYFVPHADAVAALTAVRALGPALAPVLQLGEVRTVAGDELWLSPAYGGDRLCLHFTWRPDPAAVAAVLPLVESALAPFGPRPHWAKLFTPDCPLDFPQLPRFRALAARLDPDGKFHNDFLRGHVLGPARSPGQ